MKCFQERADRGGNAQQNPGDYREPAAQVSSAGWQVTSPMTGAFSAALEVWVEQRNKVTPTLISHTTSSSSRQRTQAAQLWEAFLCSRSCALILMPSHRAGGESDLRCAEITHSGGKTPPQHAGSAGDICFPLPHAALSLTPLGCSGIWTV